MSVQRPIAHRRTEAGPEWLTLGQAATYLGVAQSTLRKWSDEGRLTAFYTPGGHRRFRLDELQAFVESSRPVSARSTGPLVLIVDDDARLREFLRVNLEHAGYGVGEAASGEDALAAIAEERPDLVLLDVVMPGVDDGWQILQRLEERHGSVPVIMFSGQVDEEAAAAEGGAAHGIASRPFDPQELLARARQLVPS